MQTPNQLREPRATPTQKYQAMELKRKVVDTINKIAAEYQEEWNKEEVREIEDYPYNCIR